MHNEGIRRQIFYLILGCSLVTLIIATAISMYGVIGAKNTAIETSDLIGNESRNNSTKIFVEETKSNIKKLSRDKANEVNNNLMSLSNEVKSIARAMEIIQNNRENYKFHPYKEAEELKAGEINFYIQHSEDFDRSAHTEEIALATNIEDCLTGVIDRNPMVMSAFVASNENFVLSADDNREQFEIRLPGRIYNAKQSDWYQKAVQKNDLIFSNVREYIFSKVKGIFCATPYYDQKNEVAGVACVQATIEGLNQILKSVELHSEGFCFVVDNRGFVILNSNDYPPDDLKETLNFDLRNSDNMYLKIMTENMLNGQSGIIETTINRKDYYIAYSPIELANWSFAIAISKADVLEPVRRNSEYIENLTREDIEKLDYNLYKTIFIMLYSICILMLIISYVSNRLSDKFVEPIHQLSDGVRDIASGNMDKKLEIHTGNEIEHLAVCFNAMTDELKTYMEHLTQITAEKERMATELDIAKDIQLSMLPDEFPQCDEYEIYATMNAAKEVGGDFYDFYMFDDNHLVITIADVSGKGIPAALFMMISKATLKNFAMTIKRPEDFSWIMYLANNQLCEQNDAMMFVTTFMMVIDLSSGEAFYVNGGHNPPVVRLGNEYKYLEVEKNFVLGGFDNKQFIQQKIKFQKGDMIYLYTDGVTEALNKAEEMYGEERLLECLKKSNKELSVEELLKYVKVDLDSFVNGADQSDDITMLSVKFNGIEN